MKNSKSFLHLKVWKAKKKYLNVRVVFLISKATYEEYIESTVISGDFPIDQFTYETKGGKYVMVMTLLCHKLELWDAIKNLEAVKATRLQKK